MSRARQLKFSELPTTIDGYFITDALEQANNLSDVASAKSALDNLTKHGSDIASANTINLNSATGLIIDVTGTTAITSITLSEGFVRIVRFTGALTLTHSGSLVLPGAANITTVAGDYATFVGYASGVVRCASYVKASGQAIVGGSGVDVTTKGDLQTFSTVPTRLGVGANDFILVADSSTATGLSWKSLAALTMLATVFLNGPDDKEVYTGDNNSTYVANVTYA